MEKSTKYFLQSPMLDSGLSPQRKAALSLTPGVVSRDSFSKWAMAHEARTGIIVLFICFERAGHVGGLPRFSDLL